MNKLQKHTNEEMNEVRKTMQDIEEEFNRYIESLKMSSSSQTSKSVVFLFIAYAFSSTRSE
jgi:uncharacterized protein YktA (UPF0223 family)